MKRLNALLIGEAMGLMCALPSLLFRSGFNVYVITNDQRLKQSDFISGYELVLDPKLMPIIAAQRNLDLYDFIIPCDDNILKNILNSDIAIEDKLKLLPVNNEKDFKHLCSKIGLSKVLSEANVNIPSFKVTNNFFEAISAAKELGYPVLAKVDFSAGGAGVFECQKESDFNSINPELFELPILIQKKINGSKIDLSALYRDGKLIHFSYSEVKAVVLNKFGPSSVRIYHQLSTIDHQIFTEVAKLGEALGANGFVNIGVIKSDDNKIYFFEADMRPTVWVDYTKFIGDDLAKKIIGWFFGNSTLQYPQQINDFFPPTKLLAYYLRLHPLEVIFNHYNVLKLMLKEEDSLILKLAYQEIICNRIKMFLRQIKRLPTTLIRLAVPDKEDRIKIKGYIRKFRVFLI